MKFYSCDKTDNFTDWERPEDAIIDHFEGMSLQQMLDDLDRESDDILTVYTFEIADEPNPDGAKSLVGSENVTGYDARIVIAAKRPEWLEMDPS